MKSSTIFWDGIAAKYAKLPVRDMQAYELALERTGSYLKKTDRVLEVGCGTGTTAIHHAPAVDKMIATDFSNSMLDVGRGRAAQQAVDNIHFKKADVVDAPDGPFDVVMAFNLLHLLPDLEGSLAEVHQRLKSDGLFISKTTCKPERGMSLRYCMMMVMLPIMQFFGKAPFVRMRSLRDLEKIIEQAGFDIIETGDYPAKPPGRFIVARKK